MVRRGGRRDARQRFQDRGETGLPQGGAPVVELDGQNQFTRRIGGLADLRIRLVGDQVVQQRPQKGGGIGIRAAVQQAPWGEGKFVQGLPLQSSAFRQIPNRHPSSGIGFAGELFYAQPVNAGDGWRGSRERRRLVGRRVFGRVAS